MLTLFHTTTDEGSLWHASSEMLIKAMLDWWERDNAEIWTMQCDPRYCQSMKLDITHNVYRPNIIDIIVRLILSSLLHGNILWFCEMETYILGHPVNISCRDLKLSTNTWHYTFVKHFHSKWACTSNWAFNMQILSNLCYHHGTSYGLRWSSGQAHGHMDAQTDRECQININNKQ